MGSAMGVGFAIAEIKFQPAFDQIRLKGFHVLDPAKVTFNVKNGSVSSIMYQDSGIQKIIPRWKYVHITNGSPCLFGVKSVFGHAEIAKAYSLIKLKQLILSNMAIASRRLATGIILGQVDSNESTVLLDPRTGKPMIDPSTGEPKKGNVSHLLFEQLKQLENFGVMVTDKKNAVSSLNVSGGEQFWTMALNIIDTQLMRCFQVPDTVFNAPTNLFGNGLTSTNQLSILDSSIMSFVLSLKESILEKVIKPLICFNYGKQVNDYYGDWDLFSDEAMQKQQVSYQNLTNAMAQGLVSSSNYEAQNKLLTMLDLTPIDYQEQMEQKQLEAQIQAMQQQTAQAVIQQPQDQSAINKEDISM